MQKFILKILFFICGCILMLSIQMAYAQDYDSMPTMQAIQEQMKKIKKENKKLNNIQADKSAFDQANAAFKQIDKKQSIVYTMPKIDAQNIKKGDISKLIDEYSSKMQKAQTRKIRSGLFLFLSFSMPQERIKDLFKQAEKARATVVFKGFIHDNIKETALYLVNKAGLTKKSRTMITIDPTAFEKYKVDRVPSYVMIYDTDIPIQQCNVSTGCNSEALPNTKLTGDVSIRYALETMARLDPESDKYVESYLKRIDGE